jgi:hypothetical protein
VSGVGFQVSGENQGSGIRDQKYKGVGFQVSEKEVLSFKF